MTTDLPGAMIFMNPVAETLIGWQAQEAVGRQINAILLPKLPGLLAGNRRFRLTKVRQHLGAEQLNGT
jgi:PAS domain S-box-containing protein